MLTFLFLALTPAQSPNDPDTAVAEVVAKIRGKVYKSIKCHLPGHDFAPSLKEFPERAYAPLLELLESTDEEVRREAVWTLALLPLQAKLEKTLKDDPSPKRRAGAAAALGHGDFPTAVPALAAALKDAAKPVRFAAAVAYVEKNGPSPADTVPSLIDGLARDDVSTRGLALTTLQRVGAVGQPATTRLKELLDLTDLRQRVEVAVTLSIVNPKESAPVPVLIEALGPRYVYWRGDVYDALDRLGPLARPALPELVRHCDNPDSASAPVYAARAMLKIDPVGSSRKAIVTLANLAPRNDQAQEILIELGEKGKEAVPILLEQLKDPKKANGGVALAAIAVDPDRAGAGVEWVRAALARGPKDDDACDIVRHLRRLGPSGKAILPELIALLKSPEVYFRQNAAGVLGDIGPAAKDALPALREVAQSDPDASTRRRAASAIKAIEAKE